MSILRELCIRRRGWRMVSNFGINQPRARYHMDRMIGFIKARNG